MKKIAGLYILMISVLVSCKETPQESIAESDKTTQTTEVINDTISSEAPAGNTVECVESETLVYQDETFTSYTEDKMRGQGVVSFTLDINDRLDIWYEDDAKFGEIVLNEDMTYFTLTMPKKTVARKVITNYDYAAFDFDAENVNTNKDYLIIYVNKQKRKVKKSDVKYTFTKWEDYIKGQAIKLKDCNLLVDAGGKSNPKSKGQAFTVTEVLGDEIKIKSTKDCLGENTNFQNLEGKVKWKSGSALVVDFAICN